MVPLSTFRRCKPCHFGTGGTGTLPLAVTPFARDEAVQIIAAGPVGLIEPSESCSWAEPRGPCAALSTHVDVAGSRQRKDAALAVGEDVEAERTANAHVDRDIVRWADVASAVDEPTKTELAALAQPGRVGAIQRVAVDVAVLKCPGFDAVPIPWPAGQEKETACHGQTEEVFRRASPSCC